MNTDPVQPLVDHLFRHESGKLVAVLTGIFGPRNLELAEDVVQDTLLKALEHWKFHGVPSNPSAWLFTVARNKALDVVRRERYKKEFADELSALLKSEYTAGTTLSQLVQDNDIEDEQLRMMFVCCHPVVAEEGQVALILKTLCGFSIPEIARAFLTSEETIAKRLYRAREQFRKENIRFEIPQVGDLPSRLESVLTAIYLLFNEGYHSSNHDAVIRDDLVEESLRLANLLCNHPSTRQPASLALLALLCFHAARLYSRVDSSNHILTLQHQDRSVWNRELIERGRRFLNLASEGNTVSTYHLEASIAYEHCIAPDFAATNWERILQIYDWLYQLKPNPLVGVNRAIIIAEIKGARAGLDSLEKIPDLETLSNYPLLAATRAEFHVQLGDKAAALQNLNKALMLSSSSAEQELLRKKIDSL